MDCSSCGDAPRIHISSTCPLDICNWVRSRNVRLGFFEDLVIQAQGLLVMSVTLHLVLFSDSRQPAPNYSKGFCHAVVAMRRSNVLQPV